MRAAALILALPLAFAAPAQAQAPTTGEGAFFCFWIDSAHQQAATTALFRAPIAQEDAIAAAFTKAMRQQAKGKGRVYDCSYRRDPVAAGQDRDSLRAAHVAKGFSLADLDWTPGKD